MDDDLDYVGAIRRDAEALVAAAERAGPDVLVPSCPDWAVADLLGHIGTVHRWAAACCERGPSEPFPRRRETASVPEDPAARPAWVLEGATRLVEVLASRAPDEPCLTWAPPPTVGFWSRRQAHETAMHRVDAQLAAGAADPIDARLASDGIDEWLTILPLRRRGDGDEAAGTGETIHLHCDDADGEWLLTLAPDGLRVAREHAKGDVAAKGRASDLLCWIMGRGPLERVEVFGDAALLERWRGSTPF